MASTKALFIALKAKHYIAFASGTKTTEFRTHGKRWNESTCYLGRPVVLSCGYGKQHRLRGRIVRFHTSTEPTQTADWQDCYGTTEGLAACIGIELESGT